MSTISTVGISFGADALAPLPTSTRQKTEQANRAEAERLADLPPQVRQWSDRLDLDDLDAMAEVARLYKAEGYSPTRMRVPDLARALRCDERDAEGRLSRLIAVGAVEKIDRLANAPVYRPCVRSTATVTSAKGEAQRIAVAAPLASIGLRHRRD